MLCYFVFKSPMIEMALNSFKLKCVLYDYYCDVYIKEEYDHVDRIMLKIFYL